jgi:hypothetical protein
MKHKHHIVPKHAGGSDDPSNLIELTVEEHAEAHRVLYEEHGSWQDYCAWQALSGRIGKEEILRMKQGKGNLGRKKTNEELEKIKEGCRKRTERWKADPEKWAEINRKRSESHKGKTRSAEHAKNNRDSRLANGKPWHSDETKKKIAEGVSKAQLGKKRGPYKKK